MSHFPANSARRGRSLCVTYLNTTSGSLKDTRLLVPVQYYFILRQSNNEQCRQQQDTSQAAMLADGEWQPVAAQAGAVVLPPFVVQVPLSGFN